MPAAGQKSTVEDILGLFGSTSTSTPPAQSSPFPASSPVQTQTISSMFSPSQTPAPAPTPAQPRLTAYPAYDKNELKITLTPQTSAQRPGVVMILARFQVAGSVPVMGLNFQAAVPKVRSILLPDISFEFLIIVSTVSTTADAPHVESRHLSRCH